MGDCLLIRADAGALMGTGHVMRCLALAQAWQAGGGVAVFAMAAVTPALESRLSDEGFEVVPLPGPAATTADARQTAEAAEKRGAGWIVVDGYHFDVPYLQCLKNTGVRLLLLDDNAELEHFSADWVLNQNLHARPEQYLNRDSGTRLLLGPRYALLRREFWPWRDWRRTVADHGAKVLVTLGGSDPDNVTRRVIEALVRSPIADGDVTVVVGGSNPYREQLEHAASRSPMPLRLVADVRDMPERMAWADMAVAAAGSTTWELAFMGLPSLVLTLADNQRQVAAAVDRAGVAINLGRPTQATRDDMGGAIARLAGDAAGRAALAARGRQLVDGDGASRVVRCLTRPLKIRPAVQDDARLLWEWANDPETRSASFKTDRISWDEHRRWFDARLHDPDCLLLVALDDLGRPVGQTRFDRDPAGAVISVSVAPECRGRGWAVPLIEQSTEECFRSGVRRIQAHVRRGNERSRRAFLRAGFQDVSKPGCGATEAVTLVLEDGVLREGEAV